MTVNKFILLVFLLGLLSSPAIAHEAHCEDTKLGEIMAQMKKSFKKLKKASKKEDYEGIKKWSENLLQLNTDAKPLNPLKLKEDPSLHLSDYQASIEDLSSTLIQISQAAASQNKDKISVLIKEVAKSRKSGHKRFRLECD